MGGDSLARVLPFPSLAPRWSSPRLVKSTELAQSNEWRTPRKLFLRLDDLFGFTLDAAAAGWNAQLPKYFTKTKDALRRRWSGRVWLNPPYCGGQVEPFMRKARAEVLAGRAELVCCLVPGYTADGWWHRQVEAPAGKLVKLDYRRDELGVWNIVAWARLTVAVCKLKGRVTFEHEYGRTKNGARHSSVLVVFLRPRGFA